MSKKTKNIAVKGTRITIVHNNQNDYICLTDIAKHKDAKRSDYIIQNWIRNRNTIEFLGIWEKINNPDFNPIEFEGFKNKAGLNSFVLTPKQWIEKTNAIGIISKAGRYGGTYAHKDIAFEFASWVSVEFKLYLIKEFQRLKEKENNQLNLEWNVKRLLSKTNYHLQTHAIQKHIIPDKNYKKDKEWIAYAEEADLLNVAIWGCTAKDWRESNPELSKKLNIRDVASINELTVLSNIESMNAALIKQGVEKETRFKQLLEIAQHQLNILNAKLPEKSTNNNQNLLP